MPGIPQVSAHSCFPWKQPCSKRPVLRVVCRQAGGVGCACARCPAPVRHRELPATGRGPWGGAPERGGHTEPRPASRPVAGCHGPASAGLRGAGGWERSWLIEGSVKREAGKTVKAGESGGCRSAVASWAQLTASSQVQKDLEGFFGCNTWKEPGVT